MIMFRENELAMYGDDLVIVEYMQHNPTYGRSYGIRRVGTPHVFNVPGDSLAPAPEPTR